MHLTSIERSPDAFQASLAAEEILAVSARAFGAETRVESAEELAGGEYNSVYRVRLAGVGPVVLRVAPPPGRAVPWHEEQLLRKEHAIQPYFAPLAPLLPRTLQADFTRQVIGRDYLFQTFMPGVRWLDIEHELTAEGSETLWRQLARIARTIHSVHGDVFGHPHPGRQFSTWSATVLDWLARSAADAESLALDASEIHRIAGLAQAHAELLDEVTVPRLMHGDLWTFNVLVVRDGPAGPRISAVLDCDRASWGDPLAEWTFHLLPRRASEHNRAIFWNEYGVPERSIGHHFRAQVYKGLHASNALSDVARRGHEHLLPKIRAGLQQAVAALTALVT